MFGTVLLDVVWENRAVVPRVLSDPGSRIVEPLQWVNVNQPVEREDQYSSRSDLFCNDVTVFYNKYYHREYILF